MRSSVSTLLFLLAVAGLASFAGTPHAATPRQPEKIAQEQAIAAYEWHPVVKIIDGDTIVVDVDGARETVRLIGLDTPETVDPRKTVQCFGEEASAQMKQVTSGQMVRLEQDPSQGERDKYGRLLAYVYVPANVRPEGIMVNRYMIAEGYGHEYTYRLPYKYQADFKAAESSAREEKKGLWADGACAFQEMSADQTSVGMRTTIYGSTTGSPECSRNAYNCSDFRTQSEAQAVFDACGTGDVHRLDSDGDGEVCESLP